MRLIRSACPYFLAAAMLLGSACDSGSKDTSPATDDDGAKKSKSKKKDKGKSKKKKADAASSTTASAPPAATEGLPEDAAKRLAALGAALGCSGNDFDGERVWCHAVQYSKGRAPEAFPAEKTLFGLTITLADGADPKDAPKKLHTSAMRFSGEDKLHGLITAITPDNDDEKKMLLQSGASVVSVLNSQIASFDLPKSLSQFISSLKPEHDVEQQPTQWIIRGNNTAYVSRVGFRAWVAVEVPKEGADLYLSLFTDRAYIKD